MLVKDAKGHASKAFERNFQTIASRAKRVTSKIKKISGTEHRLNSISEFKRDAKKLKSYCKNGAGNGI